MKKKILAVIAARKNSKGLKNKNLVKINSKPCISWTLKAAQKSKLIDLAILSTDSEKVIKIAKKMKILAPFIRPSKLSKDNSSIVDVIWHAIKWLKKNKSFDYEYVILLQASSPLRTHKHIDDSIKYYFKNSYNHKETLVSVNKGPAKSFWLLRKKGKYVNFVFKQKNSFKRQNNPIFFIPNGAIFFSKIKHLKKNFYSKRTLFYEMNERSSVDIDSIEDVKKINNYYE